jgi:hypothetical protein
MHVMDAPRLRLVHTRVYSFVTPTHSGPGLNVCIKNTERSVNKTLHGHSGQPSLRDICDRFWLSTNISLVKTQCLLGGLGKALLLASEENV